MTGQPPESPLLGNWHGGFGGRPCGKGPAQAGTSPHGRPYRPSPGPRHAQSPLPGPAQNSPASLAGRHRRQFQAPGRYRRAPRSLLSAPARTEKGDRPTKRPPVPAIEPLPPLLTPSDGTIHDDRDWARGAATTAARPQNSHLLLAHLDPGYTSSTSGSLRRCHTGGSGWPVRRGWHVETLEVSPQPVGPQLPGPSGGAVTSIRTAVDPVSPRRQVPRCEQEPATIGITAGGAVCALRGSRLVRSGLPCCPTHGSASRHGT